MRSLTKNEDGTAFFEGVLILLLFLPIWMFIIYVGTAGVGVADAYQVARTNLLQQQASGSCSGGSVLGPAATVPGIGAVGSSTYSLQSTPPATASVNEYAVGFPGSVSRNAVVGCAAFGPVSPSDAPNFEDAVRNF